MPRARRALVDEGEGAGANAFASVSDLMTALMIVFLFGAVAAKELVRPKPSARGPGQARPSRVSIGKEPTPPPGGVPSPSEGDLLWRQSKEDFLRRQLGLRVQAVHHTLFPALVLRGSELVGILAQGTKRLDASGTVKKGCAVARALAVVAYDKNWPNTTGPWGCAPGIVPKLTVQGYFQPSRLTEVSSFVENVQSDLDRLVKTYGAHVAVGAGYNFDTRTRVDLAISFTLDGATSRALSRRFAAGPMPDEERDRIWCQ